MFDCVCLFGGHDCVQGKAFFLVVPFIVIVNVDLSSKFEGPGWTIYLERLRSLEHWLVSCWCRCSQIRFCFHILIIHYVRSACPLSQGVSNLNVGFLLVPACFFSVHVIGP